MALRPGAFWPLVEIDVAVGLIGSLAAIGWGKANGREMDRDTVLFLCKMFGGISLVFFLIIVMRMT
jgi:hypothetical protein